jgi:hypothetical protein
MLYDEDEIGFGDDHDDDDAGHLGGLDDDDDLVLPSHHIASLN